MVRKIWMTPVVPVLVTLIAASIFIAGLSPSLAKAQPATPTPLLLYLPLTSSDTGAANATPQPLELRSTRTVRGLLGAIEPTGGGPFASYLRTTNDQRYFLTGSTQAIEQQIARLREQEVAAQVWGTLYTYVDPATGATNAQLIANRLLVSDSDALRPTNAPPLAVAKFDRINLHAGPQNSFASVGQVTRGEACPIVGQNAQGTWWLLECADGTRGWINALLVNTQGSTESLSTARLATATPRPAPPTATPVPATPTAVAPPTNVWRASYFANRNLSGAPVATSSPSLLSFNWGQGAPAENLPADGFSARFERAFDLDSNYYQISVRADDGVRVYLDDQLVIDRWSSGTGQPTSVSRRLTGRHTLRVEYYEASGMASLRFNLTPLEQAPVWQATYYSGTNLSGAPLLSRREPRGVNPLDYDWGSGSPLDGTVARTQPVDNFSARWRGQFRFAAGDYRFRAVADGGVRVYLDGLLVIDEWSDGATSASNVFRNVGAGEHTVTVEYYERSGEAAVRVSWLRVGDFGDGGN